MPEGEIPIIMYALKQIFESGPLRRNRNFTAGGAKAFAPSPRATDSPGFSVQILKIGM